MDMRKVKISVVTVCYNAADTIVETIESVLGQTCVDMEYVIVDGLSQDGTREIIHRYENRPWVRVVSEADSGLYNAMNKGIDLCCGEYVIFMNSGDQFYDEQVLADMLPYLEQDLVYGNVLRRRADGEEIEKYHGKYKLMLLLLSGRMMSHQSLFTRTEVMRRLRFDEQYRICADYDFVVRAKRQKCSIRYVDRTVSIVENAEGISSQPGNYDIMRREDDTSLRRSYPLLYILIKAPKGLVRCVKRMREKEGRVHAIGKD